MITKDTVLKELKENGWQAFYSHKGYDYFRLKDNFEGPEIAIHTECKDGCECLKNAIKKNKEYGKK